MVPDQINLRSSEGDGASTDYGSTTDTGEPYSEQRNKLELNEIYEKIGIGPAQYLCWTLVALVSYSDFAELTLLSIIIPTLRCEWKLTSTFEAAIMISTFTSYALCALLLSKAADLYGRKTLLRWSILLLLLAAIGGALSPNKWVFLATRLVTGASIGINWSCINCYGTEFTHSRFRTIGMMIFALSAATGIVAVSGVAFVVLRADGWRWLIIIVSLPALPALALIFTLPESPRFLCVSGQQDKAMKAVRFMARLNKKELPDNAQMISYEGEELGSYSTLLNEDNRKSTIALSVIFFNNIFLQYGFVAFLPLMLSTDFCGPSARQAHECKLLSQEDLLKVTVAGACSLVGSTAAFFSMQQVGRLIPLRVASAIMFVSVGGLFVCINNSVTFVTVLVVKLMESSVITIVIVMIPESFSTNIRSTATGFINGWGKIGGVIGTGCVYVFFYDNPYIVVGLFLLNCFVLLITVTIYDRETQDEILKET